MKPKTCAQMVAELCNKYGVVPFDDQEIVDACFQNSRRGVDAFKQLLHARWSGLKKAIEDKKAKCEIATQLKDQRQQELDRASAKSKAAAATALKNAEDAVDELEKELEKLRDRDVRFDEIDLDLRQGPKIKYT